MNYRIKDYNSLGIEVRWLDEVRSKNAYEYALKFNSNTRYGLNDDTVANIEHLDIESYSVAKSWLSDRLSKNGTLQIVYGHAEVCVIEAETFLARWADIFMPCRDDAIILHNNDETVLFYCHEEELEIGKRIS